MKKNVHNVERMVRIVIGLGLVSQVFVGIQSPWFALGIIPILTGAIGWCPPYAIFGINTCNLGQKSPK